MDRPSQPTGHKTQVLLGRLTHVKQTPQGWSAYCPVHENDGARHKPSLVVREGDKWINMICNAGCDYWSIVDALGMKSFDVALDDTPFDPNGPKVKKAPVGKRELELEAIFAAQLLQREKELLQRLRNERGWAASTLELLKVGWLTQDERLSLPAYDKEGKFHDVLRYDPFGKKHPKTLAGKGKSRTLWPAPEKIERKDQLHIVEGEGTAISMASIGLAAVSLPGGMPQPKGNASNPAKFRGAGWHPSWANRLLKHRQLVFWPDCDDTGRRLMAVAAGDCERAGARVDVVDLAGPDKFDVGDMLRYARTLELRKEARVIVEVLVASAQSHRPDQMQQAREWWKDWYGNFNGNAAIL